MNISLFNTGKYVDLEQHKEPAFSAPLSSVPIRELAYVPLRDLYGGQMYPVARKGDRCARFSLLARTKTPSNELGPSWLMAPLSGYVEEIATIEHPIFGRTFCAVIRPDNSVPPLPTTPHSLNAMTQEGVLRTIHQAGIIDEFDGRPLIEKILQARSDGIREVAAIALDDSPYISSALKTVAEFGSEVSDGITVVLKALDGGSGYRPFRLCGADPDAGRLSADFQIQAPVLPQGEFSAHRRAGAAERRAGVGEGTAADQFHHHRIGRMRQASLQRGGGQRYDHRGRAAVCGGEQAAALCDIGRYYDGHHRHRHQNACDGGYARHYGDAHHPPPGKNAVHPLRQMRDGVSDGFAGV